MINNKKNIIITVVAFVVSILYTIIVKMVDVAAIGPNDSKVGFSTMNHFFNKMIGSNMLLYKISEMLGYILLLLVIIYFLIGFSQLLKRKNVFKVDKQILILGGFYLLVLLTYIFFEKIVINYRPILIDNNLEASYPSSHTMLALCVGFSSLIVSRKYFNKLYIKKINCITVILMSAVLLLRIISGVHWISDIIGGVIISIFLLLLFKTVYYWNKE